MISILYCAENASLLSTEADGTNAYILTVQIFGQSKTFISITSDQYIEKDYDKTSDSHTLDWTFGKLTIKSCSLFKNIFSGKVSIAWVLDTVYDDISLKFLECDSDQREMLQMLHRK